MGKQSIDGDNSQTGAMVAGLLDWPQASCVFSLDCAQDHSSVICLLFLLFCRQLLKKKLRAVHVSLKYLFLQ